MEPRKFEDLIKHKLESREIQPTTKSWEQLRAKLDKKEKKAVPLKWWLGIAASFIGGILLVSTFYSTSEVVNTPQVVENSIESESEQPILQEPTEAVITQEESFKKVDEHIILNNKVSMESATKIVHATTETSEVGELMTTHPLTTEQVVISEKVEDLMTTISALEENKVPLTEEEVDALLNKATQQIWMEKQLRNSTAPINANSLLEDVEMELDQSFREKIFEMLKDGFNKTRTAIATRND